MLGQNIIIGNMLPFQEMEFPRRKSFIKNLNILLDSNPIAAPDKSLNLRAYTTQNNRQSIQRKNSHHVINAPRVETANPMKRKFNSISEHFKSVGSIKNLQAQKRMVQTGQGSRRQKMKSMLSMQNIRKQLMSSRKISTAQTHRIAKQHRQQMKNPEYDLRMVSSVQMNRDERQPGLAKFRSVQGNENREQTLYDYQCKVKNVEKKEYLRKGSSINKSILNNIIRLKMSRINESGKSPEQFIKNEEIMNMIKLYKGTLGLSKDQVDEVKPLTAGRKDRKSRQQNLYIEGWYNQTEQYDPINSHEANYQKNQNDNP